MPIFMRSSGIDHTAVSKIELIEGHAENLDVRHAVRMVRLQRQRRDAGRLCEPRHERRDLA